MIEAELVFVFVFEGTALENEGTLEVLESKADAVIAKRRRAIEDDFISQEDLKRVASGLNRCGGTDETNKRRDTRAG